MTTREAFIAVTRFGLGARPGELAQVADDPCGWLEQQLGAETTPPAALARKLSDLHQSTLRTHSKPLIAKNRAATPGWPTACHRP